MFKKGKYQDWNKFVIDKEKIEGEECVLIVNHLVYICACITRKLIGIGTYISVPRSFNLKVIGDGLLTLYTYFGTAFAFWHILSASVSLCTFIHITVYAAVI